MKLHLPLLIMAALLGLTTPRTLQAQCPAGDVYLPFQSDVDGFLLSYPTCTGLDFNLYIGDPLNANTITNLNGLQNLTFVNGGLYVQNCIGLATLSGLENITSLGGLYVNDCSDLTTLAGLQNLQLLLGPLHLNNNPQLANITSLSDLTSIGGVVYIANNPSLLQLSGLENVTTAEELVVTNNNSLLSLEGLDNLNFLNGGLTISNNPQLTSLDYLSALTDINGSVTIAANATLTDLDGLQGLTILGGDVVIQQNAGLTTLSGLDNLTSIGGYLALEYDPSLTSLSTLTNLNALGGGLRLRALNSLTSLAGLENVVLSGELRFIENTVLSDVSSLAIPSTLAEVIVDDNPQLVSLSTFSPLNNITLDLMVARQTALTDLDGLQNVTSIGGQLRIVQNPLLDNLDDLNPMLMVGSALEISGNPLLSACAVLPVCQFLVNGGVTDFSSNSSGCNSTAEVAAACSALLPIELQQFVGSYVSGVSYLTWRTASELDALGFEVQRSNNATDFVPLGFVPVQTTSNAAATYRYMDRSPRQGTNYYRLRMIDRDGSYRYSEVLALRADLNTVNLFPNPADAYVLVDFARSETIQDIEVLNMWGQCVLKQRGAPASRIELGSLPAGHYQVVIHTDTHHHTSRLVVQH